MNADGSHQTQLSTGAVNGVVEAAWGTVDVGAAPTSVTTEASVLQAPPRAGSHGDV